MNPYSGNYSWCPNPNPNANPYFVPSQSYYQQRGLDQAPRTPNNSHYWQTHNYYYKNFMAIQRYQQWCHYNGYYPTFYQRTSVKNESSKPSSEPCHNFEQPPKSYVCYPDQADQEQQLQSSSQVDICEVEANSLNEFSLISDPDMETALLDGDVTMSDISDTSLVVHEDKRRANTEDLSTVNGNLSPCKEKQEDEVSDGKEKQEDEVSDGKEKQEDEVSDEEFLAMCKKNMDELLNIEKNFIAVKDKFESLMVFEEDCDSL